MLLGKSEAIRNIHKIIEQLHKNSRIPVLITGETGVGKGLVAQAIHFGGPRASKPYVPVNCGAIPSTLSESAFLGHVRGAFTNATGDRQGYFDSAEGGTLFLDEIGDMPIDDQTTLLHVLDDGAITPIGATESRKVDVRVISATNAGLSAKVDAKLFRSDLYHRLAGMIIWIPPLRDRKEDIPFITEYYLSECAAEMDVPIPRVAPEAAVALQKYAYPGNVRELIHIIRLAVMVSDGETIQPKHLHFRPVRADVLSPPATGIDEPSPLNAIDSAPHLDDETEIGEEELLPLKDALACYERRYLRYVLERADGNRAEAARLLNISRQTLYRRLADYDL